MTNELPKELIERALALCDKNIEEIRKYYKTTSGKYIRMFSYPNFFYYLLSPEFLMAYNHKMISTRQIQHWGNDIGGFIAEYQSGNPKLIISLLSKICETNQTTAH